MASKINRILIPIFILGSLIVASQSQQIGQAIANKIQYLPLISQDPSGWIGPYAGTIVSMAIDPTNAQVVYAGTFGSGVFKSLDGGTTWHSTNQGLTNPYIYSLAIDPKQPLNIYAGTYHSQIYKSEDGGVTWNWSGSGMQEQAIVYDIAVDPFSPSIVYAATRGKSNNNNPPWNGVLYRSEDAGLTWESSLENLGGPDIQDWVYSVIVNPNAHNEILAAAHESGPYRSNNFGEHWSPMNNGVKDFSGRSIAIGQQPDSSLTLYYGVWHKDSVYKSIDGGSSWLPANQGISYEHVYRIALDPVNINNVFLATFKSGILKSTDGGNSWQTGGLPLDQIYSLVINPFATKQMLAGTAGDGVYQTWDGGENWSHSSTGINNATITSAVVLPANPATIVVSILGGGVYQSNDRGRTWIEMNDGLTNLSVFDLVKDPINPGVLYALTNEGGLFKNDLNGDRGWVLTGAGIPMTSMIQEAYPADNPFATLSMQEAATEPAELPSTSTSTYITLMKMAYAPSNPQIAYLATGGMGVYRSGDGGQTWLAAGLHTNTVNDIAIDVANPSLVYAISSATGTETYTGTMQISIDGGSTWSAANSAMNFYSLVASPAEAGVLYAGTGKGIYRYQSGVWSSLGLAERIITALKLDADHPNIIIAGTDSGAYYSNDGGKTWKIVDNSLTGQTIESIIQDTGSPNLVFFGTQTHGVYLAVIQF